MFLEKLDLKNLTVEGLGSFFLSFILLITIFTQPLMVSMVVVALLFAILVYLGGKNLKGYFNPAITLALLSRDYLKTKEALVIIFHQVIGALAGRLLAGALVEDFSDRLVSLHDFVASTVVVGIGEAVGLLLLMWVVVIIVKNREQQTSLKSFFLLVVAFYIGVVVSVSVGGFGVLNPALAIAYGLVGNPMYMLGPVVGAVLAVFGYDYITDSFSFEKETEDVVLVEEK